MTLKDNTNNTKVGEINITTNSTQNNFGNVEFGDDEYSIILLLGLSSAKMSIKEKMAGEGAHGEGNDHSQTRIKLLDGRL